MVRSRSLFMLFAAFLIVGALGGGVLAQTPGTVTASFNAPGPVLEGAFIDIPVTVTTSSLDAASAFLTSVTVTIDTAPGVGVLTADIDASGTAFTTPLSATNVITVPVTAGATEATGTITFRYTANDQGLTTFLSSDSFDFTVDDGLTTTPVSQTVILALEDAITASAPTTLSVTEGNSVTIDIAVGGSSSGNYDVVNTSALNSGILGGEGNNLPPAAGVITLIYTAGGVLDPAVTSETLTLNVSPAGLGATANTVVLNVTIDLLQAAPTATVASPVAAVEGLPSAISVTIAYSQLASAPPNGGLTVNLLQPPGLGAIAETFPLTIDTSTTPTTFTLTYTPVRQPTVGFEANDAFIFEVVDNEAGLSSGGTLVDITITPVDTGTFANDIGPITVAAGSSVQVVLAAQVATNPGGGDLDGDPVAFSAGISTLGAFVSTDGSVLTYEAPPTTNDLSVGPQTDAISYTVTDAANTSDTATATVTFDVVPIAGISFTLVDDDSGAAQTVTKTVQVGVANPGTGIDALADTVMPPSPPASSYELEVLDESTGTEYLRDIAELSAPVTLAWTLRVVTGDVPAGGTQPSLTWDAFTEVPALLSQIDTFTNNPGSYALITDRNTGETWDLASANVGGGFPLQPNSAYLFDVTISEPQSVTPFSLPVNTGWNAISIPGKDADNLLALRSNTDLSSPYLWDPIAQNWVGTTMAALDQAAMPPVAGAAFVYLSATSTSVLVDKLDVDSPNIRDVIVQIEPGWNLIGAPFDVPSGSPMPAALITDYFVNQSAVFVYDSSTGSYLQAGLLFPGEGYFVFNDTGAAVNVHLTQARHLDPLLMVTLNHAPSGTEAVAALDWALPLSLDLADGTERSVTLGVASGAEEAYDRFDLAQPPAPPAANISVFYVDVDDAVRRLTRSVQPNAATQEWHLTARMATDGELRWQSPRLPEGIQMMLAVDGQTTLDMRERARVRLSKGTHELRVFARRVMPEASRLLPNYPNPFNPETWIPFELKEAADVVIDIYALDGERVRSLHLGQLDAGFYTQRSNAAYWDGRNENGEPVASGVYVYRLRAGSYQAIRRMVILK